MKLIIRNEYEMLKNLDNKLIVKAYELIEAENKSIIIMEYV